MLLAEPGQQLPGRDEKRAMIRGYCCSAPPATSLPLPALAGKLSDGCRLVGMAARDPAAAASAR
jgi:hypothetical protein